MDQPRTFWPAIYELLTGPAGGFLLVAAGAVGVRVLDRFAARSQAFDTEKIRLSGWLAEKRLEAYQEIMAAVQELGAASRSFFVEFDGGLPVGELEHAREIMEEGLEERTDAAVERLRSAVRGLATARARHYAIVTNEILDGTHAIERALYDAPADELKRSVMAREGRTARGPRIEALIGSRQREAETPMLDAMRRSFGDSALSSEMARLVGEKVAAPARADEK